ncbi:hypothetical protein ACWC1D_35320 [Streptomyces sp. NPDC001478]
MEILLREEPFRSPVVMDRFMRQISSAITEITGLTTRIRCFRLTGQSIHALK